MIQHLLHSMVTPLLFTLPAWVIYRGFRITKKKQANNFRLRREILLFVLYLYFVVLGTLTLLPQMDVSGVIPSHSNVNGIPLVRMYHKVIDVSSYPGSLYMSSFLINLLGNIFLFVPLGLLLPYITSKLRSIKKIMFVAFLLSFSIEVFQYLLTYLEIFRFSDIDDVILNVLGAMAGYGLYKLFNPAII